MHLEKVVGSRALCFRGPPGGLAPSTAFPDALADVLRGAPPSPPVSEWLSQDLNPGLLSQVYGLKTNITPLPPKQPHTFIVCRPCAWDFSKYFTFQVPSQGPTGDQWTERDTEATSGTETVSSAGSRGYRGRERGPESLGRP